MSGGPPHHPHNRQVPATNSAWNHLQVPNYFPRQPQLAHMSSEHSLLHQPSWHTPTTEAMKIHPHTQIFNEMFKNDPLFPKDCVDLSLARNGNQNGELSTTPISLSVRDTNKINSLPPSALEIQAVELTKPSSPGLKPASPGLKSISPGIKSLSPGLNPPSPGLKSVSPGLKSASPGLKYPSSISPGLIKPPGSPSLKSASPKCDSPSTKLTDLLILKPMSPQIAISEPKMSQKRSNIRVDSILERLNPNTPEKQHINLQEVKSEEVEFTGDKPVEKTSAEKPVSVIVQPSGSFDENSNSNSISNVPSSTNVKDEDTVSTNSNEDSLDSTKSRRKRKPVKTVRVSKDEEKCEDKFSEPNIESVETKETAPESLEIEPEKDPIAIVGQMLEGESNKLQERSRSSDDLEDLIPAKSRRKTSSESETIDDIAAMVQEGLKEKQMSKKLDKKEDTQPEPIAKPISVSVIKTKENIETLTSTLAGSIKETKIVTSNIMTPAQKKATNTHFVEVENRLEEMFAGIEDSSDPLKTDTLDLDDSKLEDPLLKLDDSEPIPVERSVPSTSQDNVTVSSTTEVKKKTPSPKKKRKALSSRSSETNSLEDSPKKKKPAKKTRSDSKSKSKTKKPINQKYEKPKNETVKDIYAYDSGSNASSNKSRGPYIQIRGPRDSPLSVSVVNTPLNDEDGDRKLPKSKKFHDDIEYRHKVRSKGLHSSTLSNKYDAQTKDVSWICVFCKRGPHASELSGPTSNGNVLPPGDLFGPYFITTECVEFERRLEDPYDRQFKSRKITKALDEAVLLTKSMKKSKRKHSDADSEPSDVYLGITETDSKSYEIWAHEDCVVWSSGIYLVGPKIVGLEEAVWTCCNISCKLCHLKGANISCMRRGCLAAMHLCCARTNDWQFFDSTFKAYCPQHRIP